MFDLVEKTEMLMMSRILKFAGDTPNSVLSGLPSSASILR